MMLYPLLRRAIVVTCILTGGCGSDVSAGTVPPETPPGSRDAGPAAASAMPAWIKLFGGPANDSIAMTVDDAGNVYATGLFSGTVDFGGGPLVAEGTGDVYVASFDLTGSHRWSRRFGAEGIDRGRALAFHEGTVYVTGSFQRTVDFGGGGLSSAGLTDVFVLELEASSGAHKRSARYGGAVTDEGTAIVATGGGFVLAGAYRSGSVSFGGSALTNTGGEDIFVARFDSAGDHVWSMRFGGSSSDMVTDLDVDASGNVYFVGNYGSSVDFGGGTLASGTLGGIYVASLDPAGAHRWSKGYPISDLSIGSAVVLDGKRGRLIVGGWVQAPTDLGSGSVQGGFVANLDPATGATHWTKAIEKQVHDVAVAGDGTIYATGQRSAYAMLAKLDEDLGSVLVSLTSPSNCAGGTVALFGEHVFVSGRVATSGSFGGAPVENHGGDDAFLLRLSR
jgi:hypothetical protein